MSNKTITLLLEQNGLPTTYVTTFQFRPNYVYYLDLPALDFREWGHIRIKVAVKDAKEEP